MHAFGIASAKKIARAARQCKKTLFFSDEKAYNNSATVGWWTPHGLFFVWNARSVNIVQKNFDFIAKDDKNAAKQILRISFTDEAYFSLVADEEQQGGIPFGTYP